MYAVNEEKNSSKNSFSHSNFKEHNLYTFLPVWFSTA